MNGEPPSENDVEKPSTNAGREVSGPLLSERRAGFSGPITRHSEVMMSFTDAIKSVFRQYATFSGRARRSEFWYWVLFSALVGIVLSAFAGATGGIQVDPATGMPTYGATGLLANLVSLALFLPSLAVTVRRLHDTDRSGFWWFIGFVPLVGAVILIVFTALAGTVGPNRFGADPKGVDAAQPAGV
jgi:uncharacterized membrane protein YhaH (DUF805 family)